MTLPNDFYEVTPALLGMPQHGFQQPQGAQATLLPKPQGPQISVQNQSQPPPNLVENPIEIPHDGAQQPPEVQTNLIPMLQAAQSPRSHSPERGVYGSPIQWGGNQTWPSVLFLDLPQNPIVAMARESNPNANQDSIGTESVLPDGQMYPPPPLRPPDGFRDR